MVSDWDPERRLGGLDVKKMIETYRSLQNLAEIINTVISSSVLYFVLEGVCSYALSLKDIIAWSSPDLFILLCYYYFIFMWILYAASNISQNMQVFRTWLDKNESYLTLTPRQLTLILDSIHKESVAIEISNVATVNFAFVGTVRAFSHWSDLIPYHPVVTCLHWAIEKCGIWGWIYSDVFAIALSRALTEKLRSLNEVIDTVAKMAQRDDGLVLYTTWDLVRDEFLMLIKLNREIQLYISPIILGCYGSNVFSIIINLYIWISPISTSDFKLAQSYYAFAFFAFMFRVVVVTYYAAEVHQVSNLLLQTIHKCPNILYNITLERMEKSLESNPIGIHIFGSFKITRRFFVSIISLLFTTEIVLFQTASITHRN
ncbi:unnamed protein product [Orchesella dallaii]|uniref:Gustatory receptor n=1 Tax=Orchesella dallaii TaxID=48710 RepID=A0ABP1S767_9HEXA